MRNPIRLLLFAAAVLIFAAGNAQTYYKKIRYESGHFSQELPTGYRIFVVGPVDTYVDSVILTISSPRGNQPYVWTRSTADQKEFEVLINPLVQGVTYTFSYREAGDDKHGLMDARKKTNEILLTEEKVNSLQLGLVSGMGVAFLGRPYSDMKPDMFGFVALKWNLVKVDKTRKFLGHDDKLFDRSENEVYTKKFSRFSVLVGGATTKMGYKGKEVFNPVYNIKPMFGFSYNFNPELSVDGGIIFFDYQNGDPSLHTELDRKLSTGLFVSVSVDFDVFTRLKKAMAGLPYDETQKN